MSDMAKISELRATASMMRNSGQLAFVADQIEEAADTITALQSERTNLIDTKRQQLAAKDEEIQRWKDTALEEAQAFEDQKAVNADLRERLLAAEKALEPFAQVGGAARHDLPDSHPMLHVIDDWGLDLGQFRLARTTLNQIKGTE